MIKKILSTMLVSSALLVSSTFSAMSERPTIAIGGSVNYGGYVASGQENEGTLNHSAFQATETSKRTAAMEVGYSSAFLEVNMRDRLTIGVEYMAAEVETDKESRTDTIAPADATVGGTTGDTGTSSVKVQFSDMVTVYAELRVLNGMYIKAGSMQIDVESKESLHTSSSYGNITLDGIAYGLGYKNSWDNGMFLKAETMMHDWDSFKLSATSDDAVPNGNTVEGNLDGAILSIRLGKAF
jgi:hypothetical protein